MDPTREQEALRSVALHHFSKIQEENEKLKKENEELRSKKNEDSQKKEPTGTPFSLSFGRGKTSFFFGRGKGGRRM